MSKMYPFKCIRCGRDLQRCDAIPHYEGDATEPFAITCYGCGNYPLAPESSRRDDAEKEQA